MKYAIIAAGRGSRLVEEGVALPKPLVTVGGLPLVERLARIMASRNDCEGIELIVNEEDGPRIKAHLDSLVPALPVSVTILTTGGSMQSLAALLPRLGSGPVCVSTVDAVFPPDEFGAYADAFHEAPAPDALMAVTRYVNDEKPLYVATGETDRITGFFDTPAEGVSCVSGGIYILGPEALAILADCVESGVTRMRDYQRALVAAGLDVRARFFSTIVDVDHIADIAEAERLFRSQQNHL